jgi:hypothetical protein
LGVGHIDQPGCHIVTVGGGRPVFQCFSELLGTGVFRFELSIA